MHRMQIYVIALACLCGLTCAETTGGKTGPKRDEVQTSYTASQIARWTLRKVDGKDCRVSPMITFGKGTELNHHKVTVTYSTGSVELSLAHSTSSKLDTAIEKKHLHSKLLPVKSGTVKKIVSPYKGERYAWIIARAVSGAKITAITHTCWKGKGTLYGHGPGKFKFGGAALPFRMMLPRNFDPRQKKKYPLVISVSGSGGVGEDNRRNMEMVILARNLFTTYLNDEEFECISIVPQIPSGRNIPKPYWPRGPLGKPTPIYHPGLAAVNENGWYTQASIALIKDLISDEGLHVDPDRIYFTGFSYGGKACWEFLRAGRELFAAAICGAGWPIGKPYSIPTRQLKARLKLEVKRIKHIPVSIFAGQKDNMKYGSQAVHAEITAQGGKSTYVEFPRASHVATAGSIWRNRRYIAWLFKQNRKNNPKPPADPYPKGIYDK
jgi:poly(3-hydroxybutyrate) depolymerase